MSTPGEHPGGQDLLEDVPRVGWLTWVFFLAMLAAPAYLVWVYSQGLEVSHLTLWVGLLCLPPLVTFILLPRRYILGDGRLLIEGLFYRRRFMLEKMKRADRASVLGALLSPTSIYCTDPLRAVRLEFEGRAPVIISPNRPREFLELLRRREGNRHED